MISVAEAKRITREHVQALPPRRLSLQDASGMVLAEAVFAASSIPGFRQSSMDGYAFSFDDWQPNKKLTIKGIVAAGGTGDTLLQPGNAVRIFTGAALPPGADTVVIQEKTTVDNGQLRIEDDRLQRGMHVRAEGAEIKKGALALAKDSLLTPAAIGFLTAMGTTQVLVYPRPAVSIVVTGNELQEPGMPLQYGQVYEANSVSLKAALQQLNISPVKVYRAKDNLNELTTVLGTALEESDLVFLTGGISVGDYDFVLQATINNGVEQLFHKIKQRPAKPLYFGKKNGKYIFGLPGNPASGLISFYEYAAPVIGILCKRNFNLESLQAPLEQAFKKPAGLTHFLKGWYNGKTVAVLDAQESYRLSSFAKANCLIQVDEDATACAAGALVEIHRLPS
ncbi:MAG: gephyrin-like molybdotransferase Glp [Bacteroidota bacterium]